MAETKSVQRRIGNRIKRLWSDRGFHSPENQIVLAEVIPRRHQFIRWLIFSN